MFVFGSFFFLLQFFFDGSEVFDIDLFCFDFFKKTFIPSNIFCVVARKFHSSLLVAFSRPSEPFRMVHTSGKLATTMANISIRHLQLWADCVA